MLAVGDLVISHCFEYRTTAVIVGGQALEVSVEMAFDLPLGLDDEAQTCPITGQSRDGTDHEGAGVPQRIEQAGAGPEFLQSGGEPGEVIGFLLRGIEEELAGLLAAGNEGLAVVQTLRGDLTRMIDPHEGCRGSPVSVGEHLSGRRGRLTVQGGRVPG
jgi:hypothetical protein